MRTLSLGIPPQNTSTGQEWQEMTPYTALVYHPYLYLPPSVGRWGGLTVPNSMFPLTMGREQSGRKVDSALQ